MTIAEATTDTIDAFDRLADHLPAAEPVRRGLVAGLRAATGLRPRRWTRLLVVVAGSVLAVLVVRAVRSGSAASSDVPSPADVLPEPPEEATSTARSVAATTRTAATREVPADDEVLDLDAAALILGTPPEQVRTMLADGLLVAEDPAAPTFRAAAVRAVRLAGG